MRPLHVGDYFFGHLNEAVPTSFLLPNLVSNHLVICLLFDYIGGAISFVPLVGLGVDERTFDCKLLLVLFIRKLLLWLRTLVRLVTSLWHFEQVTMDPFSNFFTMFSRLS